MRAILRKQFGGPDVLEIREIPEPEPKAGHAVIQVKAFGINHAEKHMREGQWAEIAAAGRYQAKPSRVFRFEDIREAHRVMDANQAKGKMVVVV